tara:strand:+ start:7 stop:1134 length:1128 start_codon:yes stop_codon:yes gene_type:complete
MKVSVVGGGNAGVLSALFLSWCMEEIEVELIYDPEILPERVGQATVLEPPGLLWSSIGFNWYDNPIHATMKSGILYEGWGKLNDKVFHDFPADSMAMHYCPWEMQNAVLKSGHFKVIEDKVDPRSVDADYVFDCRGKPEDFSDYDPLINPTNACILAKPNWDTSKALWSRHVTTPDGWTFVIPTHLDSPSHNYCVGYCYNSNITSKEEAEKNMLEMFDVEITKHINYKNYVAKKPIDGRIILNGNRLFFLEPLESSSTQAYMEQVKFFSNVISQGKIFKTDKSFIKDYIHKLETYVLWHYQFGSKYNTPFWDFVKKLPFNPDYHFLQRLNNIEKNDRKKSLPYNYMGGDQQDVYGQWGDYAFKLWHDGMFKKKEK